MGACLEYAARVGMPLMIYVFSDGSLVLQRHDRQFGGGRGKGVWTGDNQSTASRSSWCTTRLARSRRRSCNQIGHFQFRRLGHVSTGSPGANAVNLLAEMVVLNYMALHGQEGAFQTMTYANGMATGLGAASNYDKLIAFGQLSSVVNGVIT
jgi:hypothetical protein